eukprot:6502145-Alexandrium_andersonii.AAC.1
MPSNATAQQQRRSKKLPHLTCLAPWRCRAPISAACRAVSSGATSSFGQRLGYRCERQPFASTPRSVEVRDCLHGRQGDVHRLNVRTRDLLGDS